MAQIESLSEYGSYQMKFHAFMTVEGITNLSYDGTHDEFSTAVCDVCGDNRGGARYDATGFHAETYDVHDYIICMDCLHYAEYGQLDDVTMMMLLDEDDDE